MQKDQNGPDSSEARLIEGLQEQLRLKTLESLRQGPETASEPKGVGAYLIRPKTAGAVSSLVYKPLRPLSPPNLLHQCSNRRVNTIHCGGVSTHSNRANTIHCGGVSGEEGKVEGHSLYGGKGLTVAMVTRSTNSRRI
jgi:hypothetical protein